MKKPSPITKRAALSALLAFTVSQAGSPSWAGEQPAATDVHESAAPVAVCATIQAFAGEALVLDSSRAHVDEAQVGRGVVCEGWVSVQTGWIELKHRDGHVVRMGANSFAQFNVESESVTLLRGMLHARTVDEGAELRLVTPNARARIRQGSGILVYRPEAQRSQWVTLERMAAFENRFAEESHVTVAEGEGSVLDLSKTRVLPIQPRAITVASLKPLLKSLDFPEKATASAVRVALTRQRRVLPAILAESSIEGMRSPASIAESEAETAATYKRHAPADRDAKVERRLARKWSGGAPVSLLEPELLEKRLEAKSMAREKAEKQRVIRELERMPTSDSAAPSVGDSK